MIRRPEKDTEHPPGQIVNPIPDAITERNIRAWKKWEESRKKCNLCQTIFDFCRCERMNDTRTKHN